jgi:hypothetical protein
LADLVTLLTTGQLLTTGHRPTGGILAGIEVDLDQTLQVKEHQMEAALSPAAEAEA